MAHWTERTFLDEPDLFLRELQSRVEDGRRETQALIEWLDAVGFDPASLRVLDLACGPGVHAADLAAAGATVHGIDIAATYLERARERAAERGVAARTSFWLQDMRDVDALDATYDLITNRYSSFGYFDASTDRAILRRCYDRLEPGGALAFELRNREGLLASFEPETVEEDGDQRRVQAREYDPETARLETTTRVHDADTGARLGTYETSVRVYAPSELRRVLEETGFDVDLFADFAGTELARESPRFVAIGRK